MIPLWIIVVAFSILAYITKSRTYMILAFSALVNVYVDTFTSADDQYLMVTYASIEFFTALAILYFGDVHKIFQSIILTLMLCNHYVMEFALTIDNVSYIESDIYSYIITLLIILQLIGAGRGMDKLTGLSGANTNRVRTIQPNFFDRQSVG